MDRRRPPSAAALSRASDKQLALAAQAGDTAAREELVLRHHRLVRGVVRSFRGAGFPAEDLLQAGTIGLLLAVDRFDPERGASFVTYASALIRGELRHLLRDQGWAVRVPRPLQELGHAAAREEARLTQVHGVPATVDDVSASLGEEGARVAEALLARAAYRSVELCEDGGEDAGVTPALTVEETGFEEVEHRVALAAALPRLPIRQRRIITMRFWRDMKQEHIARELGMSQMHVSRLLGAALRNLAAAMGR